MKFRIIILMLFVFILSLGAAAADDNLTAAPQDDLSQTTVEGATFDDIQRTIDVASEKEVIELNQTAYTGSSSIKIKKSLTIQSTGKPAVLDGGNDTRIFYIEKGDVTFKNLIFTNAVSNKGGAIYTQGNCVFENCTFINNYAEYGAGIYTKASLTLKNTEFTHNMVKLYGGAVACQYTANKNASKNHLGNVVIDNCLFTDNEAVRGGAVSVDLTHNDGQNKNNFGLVTITNSRFFKNRGLEFGGAVDYNGSPYYGKLTVGKSNFTQNLCDEGSAINIMDSSMTLTDSDFSQNAGYLAAVHMSFQTSQSSIKNCSFKSNSADGVSAVILYGSKATLTDCVFTSNTAPAISSYSDSVLKITNGKTTKTYNDRAVFDNSLKSSTTLTVTAKDFTTTYDSREKFTFQLINKNTKKPVKYYSLNIQFKSSKKTKTFWRSTNVNGKLSLTFMTSLAVGTYKVTYISDDWGLIDSVTHTVTVKKAQATVKAPKVTYKYKKSKNFKITLKDKFNEGIYKVKVKVKVYTGKKAKTYNLKTDYNGVCKINTKKLSKGSHKVVISSSDDNYKFSLKSKIKIKK